MPKPLKKRPKKANAPTPSKLRKCPTGIKGFDEITGGGLPTDRITLVAGGTGSGKTLLGLDFIINGATVGGHRDPQESVTNWPSAG